MLGKSLWNNGWEFYKDEVNTPAEKFLADDASENNISTEEPAFKKINIPHDWLIYQGQHLYESSTGFYRKSFELDKNSERRYELYFEGVYMDSTVYVNGIKVGEWKYGYSSFYFDVTNELVKGKNTVLVRVNYQSPNSRWYSGAGIYRNVWFIEKPATHFVTDSLYVVARPENMEEAPARKGFFGRLFGKNDSEDSGESKALVDCRWEVMISAEITGGMAQNSGRLRDYLINLQIPAAEINESFSAYNALYAETEEGYQLVRINAVIDNPKLWSLEKPFLYDMKLSLVRKPNLPDGIGEAVTEPDFIDGSFGLRTIDFDVNKGFFLNGKHLKINGVCEHHDLGALGAAFNKSAMRRELEILRDMGVNAVRTAHNMPAPELLELTDEMGFLVMNEAFDMWERPKTEHDYGVYFKEWQAIDVRSWIRRDRNHPSVVMWSIGNEIYDTHADEHGQEITRTLMEEVKSHDYFGNAFIVMGSNYMQWEGAQKCTDILKFAGYNYAERLYDEHHAEHPDWHIFGSETSSTLQSRGIYHFPYSQPGLAEEDDQCSCLGNCTAAWGARDSEYCITMDRDREYSAGQFIWSGFDYIGESTPYKTRNCYFGQIDTAGFFKDTAYIYRAAWTDYRTAPFIHIIPSYWDYNEGQLIDVRLVSNAPSVQLFVNGQAMEKVAIDPAHAEHFTADYVVPFEKGVITAIAYDENGREIAKDEKKSFGEAAKLTAGLHYSKAELVAGRGELAFIEIGSVDCDGNPVENDNTVVSVDVSGAGWLTGLDNGDSTDVEEYKGHCKRLFAGKMLAIIAAGSEPGIIRVTVKAHNMEREIEGTELTIRVVADSAATGSGVSLLPEILFSGKATVAESGTPVSSLDNGIWVRKLELSVVGNDSGAADGNISANDKKLPENRIFCKNKDDIRVRAILHPYGSSQELVWSAVTDTGVATPLAKVTEIEKTEDGEIATIHALGDGHFRLRCMTRNGMRVAKIISELEFEIKDHGQATLNPYELIPGSVYTRSQGELGNGIQHGVASADGRSVITFDMLDMGDFGSDEITVPIFELGGNPCPIEIWEGVPGEDGAEKLYETVYQKPSIWQTYQADTYKLPRRVRGITTISLVFQIKVNIAGIRFTRFEKAYGSLTGADRDTVFGDSFREEGTAIRDIGNNVSIEYFGMNFGEEGATKLSITGSTPNEANTIHVVFGDSGAGRRAIIEFPHSDEPITRTFELTEAATGLDGSSIKGEQVVRFIFLPGSRFDFEGFRFEK